MNLNFLTLSFLILSSLVYSQTSTNDQEPVSVDSSKNCCEQITTLSHRIDSIETRLEHLQIQVVESDPFKSAKYLKWGSGLTFTISKSVPRISSDIGYTFITPKSFRAGIAFGFDGELGSLAELPAYGFYGKVTAGTPVLINFLSINSYFRTLYYPKTAYTEGSQNSGGICAGAELEFWFMPSWCYTFGGSLTALQYKYEFQNRVVGEINFAGFKFFPQSSRKKK